MLKKSFVFLFLVSSFILASGGSVYSRYGAGDNFYYMSAGKLALGGPGLATTGKRNIDNMNPAGWSSINLVRLEAGLNYNGILMESESSDAFYSNYDFTGFLVAIPVSEKYGVTITGGLTPFTRVGYEVKTSGTEGTDAYETNYEGKGGLSKLFIGSSYNTPLGFTIGASLDYYTGKIDYTTKLEFTGDSDFNDSEYINRLNYNGMGFTFGLLTDDITDYIPMENVSKVRLGLMLSYIGTLRTDSTVIVNSTTGETEIAHGLTDSEFPIRFGTGIAFELSNEYLVNVDYLYQPWSEYKYNKASESYLKDQSRINVGVEYKNEATQFSSFWEQIIFRGGFSYEAMKYSVNGNDLTQYSVHAGAAFPLGVENKIDIGFSYGLRGTTESNLLKENVFNLAVTFSFGELWFVRQDR